MIGQLSGIIKPITNNNVIINVNDIGYEVEMPTNCQAKLSTSTQKQTIYTHFIVREDAQLLFGFSSQKIRNVFRTLIKASGVGPKAAIAILSHFEINDLIHCIETQSVASLVAVKGIGAKLAQKMTVELKGSLTAFVNQQEPTISTNHLQEIKAALEALGYKSPKAEQAAIQAIKSNQQLSREDLIKQALKLVTI